jgi:SAM-dependent methyltransferase
VNGDNTDPDIHPVHAVLAGTAAPPPDGLVVDLGCGPGRTLAALADRWAAVDLVGIDITAASLEVARHAATRAILVQADLAAGVPLKAGSVDVLVCHNVIELLPDPLTLFTEARRVLRPGGRAIWSHTDFAGLVIHGADEDLTTRIRRAYAEVPQRWMAHIDPYAGRRIPGLARRAGFTMDAFDAHTLACDALSGQAWRRVDEITEVVARHARHGHTDLTETEIGAWRAQLGQADARGEFCFAETAFVTTTRTSR